MVLLAVVLCMVACNASESEPTTVVTEPPTTTTTTTTTATTTTTTTTTTTAQLKTVYPLDKVKNALEVYKNFYNGVADAVLKRYDTNSPAYTELSVDDKIAFLEEANYVMGKLGDNHDSVTRILMAGINEERGLTSDETYLLEKYMAELEDLARALGFID
jgi:CCR4-NOT transcriptional regulation complex NOT5 subunit